MIFAHYGIAPSLTCHACVNRELVQVPRFWQILAGKRVLLVTRELDELQAALVKEPYHLDIVSTLAFDNYDQMDETLQWIEKHQEEFDVALFSCGLTPSFLQNEPQHWRVKSPSILAKPTI